MEELNLLFVMYIQGLDSSRKNQCRVKNQSSQPLKKTAELELILKVSLAACTAKGRKKNKDGTLQGCLPI